MDSSKIIYEIAMMIRRGASRQDICVFVCQAIATSLTGSRCVLWMIDHDQLVAVLEFSPDGKELFLGTRLNLQESMTIVLEILSSFPDESSSGVQYISDTTEATSLHFSCATLDTLLQSSNIRSRLLGQLRARGIFTGWIEVQTVGKSANWSDSELQAFEEVTKALSVFVQMMYDIVNVRLERESFRSLVESLRSEVEVLRVGTELKAIFVDSDATTGALPVDLDNCNGPIVEKEIGSLFKYAQDSKTAWKSAAALLATHLGFDHAQVYLRDQTNGVETLIPQIDDEVSVVLKPNDFTNPFVQASSGYRCKLYNLLEDKNMPPSPFFGDVKAIIFPLEVDLERLGVVGFWKRSPSRLTFRPEQIKVGEALVTLFSKYARQTANWPHF